MVHRGVSPAVKARGNAIQNASPGNKKAYWYFSARNNVKADGSHEMIVIPDGCANIYSHN